MASDHPLAGKTIASPPVGAPPSAQHRLAPLDALALRGIHGKNEAGVASGSNNGIGHGSGVGAPEPSAAKYEIDTTRADDTGFPADLSSTERSQADMEGGAGVGSAAEGGENNADDVGTRPPNRRGSDPLNDALREKTRRLTDSDHARRMSQRRASEDATANDDGPKVRGSAYLLIPC